MLINLGTVYSNMGRKDEVGTLYVHESLFSKAELLYSESLKIIKKLLGPEDIEYATSLYHLGVLYDQQGKYSKAEKLYLECLAIRKKIRIRKPGLCDYS